MKPNWESDNRIILPALIAESIKVDLCLTDPPYGIGTWSASGGNSISEAERDDVNKWDSAPDAETFKNMLAISQVAIVWGGNYLMDEIGRCRAPLVWDKAIRGMHLADGEMAWTNFGWGTLRILNFPIGRGDTVGQKKHPTQKPVRVMSWCLDQAKMKPGMTVIDPFMGSGTTGVACVLAGLKFIGVEMDPDYFSICVDRIKHELAQPCLPALSPVKLAQGEIDL